MVVAGRLLIRLVRAYLNAGIMDGGVVVERHLGTPQGGPLSPLLANVLLDDVDKALEARGYSFARYADDCNVYVGSMKAGHRVMALLGKLYGDLKLQINEAKSAVASALGRKFLGYALWVAQGREVKCAVAHKVVADFKARVRQLTRRSGGRSMERVVQRLRPYLLGWKAYLLEGRPVDQRCKLDQLMPLIDEVDQFHPEQVLLGGVMSGLRTHRRPRCSLQGTESNWASILQLAPSAIARKASNGAGSWVVQGGLYSHKFETRRQAKDEVTDWLLWYNLSRTHSTLSCVCPMKFEKDWLAHQPRQVNS